jgi:hypothetical protein
MDPVPVPVLSLHGGVRWSPTRYVKKKESEAAGSKRISGKSTVSFLLGLMPRRFLQLILTLAKVGRHVACLRRVHCSVGLQTSCRSLSPTHRPDQAYIVGSTKSAFQLKKGKKKHASASSAYRRSLAWAWPRRVNHCATLTGAR